MPRTGHATWWPGPVLAILMACAGCTGGSSNASLPTLPTGLQTGLQPGAYVLEVTGADPAGLQAGCIPVGQPAAGRRAAVAGTLVRDGEAWVFRSDRPGTDLVFRVRVATQSFSTELFAIDGTLRGTAADEAVAGRAATGVTMTVSEPTVVEGELKLTGALLAAFANGNVVFSDTIGRATCARVAVAMQPAARLR